MTTAFLIAEGGDCLGVPSFILFTFDLIGDDLFLFRFLPPLGVFGVFFDERTLGVGFDEIRVPVLASLTGVTIGDDDDDLAFERAEAGVDIIGVVNMSASPVKLMSRELLLFAFFPEDFLDFIGVDFFTDLDDFPAGSDFLADLGVPLGVFPFGDRDLALLGEDLADDGLVGTVFGVPILEVGAGETTGVFFKDDGVEALGVEGADLLLGDFLALLGDLVATGEADLALGVVLGELDGLLGLPGDFLTDPGDDDL